MAEIKVTLDASQFEKAIRDLQQVLTSSSSGEKVTAATQRANAMAEERLRAAKAINDEKILTAELNKEVANLNKQIKESNLNYNTQKNELAKVGVEYKKLLVDYKKLMLERQKEKPVNEVVAGSYNAINAEMLNLIKTSKNLNMTNQEGQAAWSNNMKRVQELDGQLKMLDMEMGRHQRNVGNYKSAFDGLGFSIQQIGRELPSLAYGPRVFFSAISNNLPMMSDQIRIARKELAALHAEGKVGVPVWKQVTQSIFSWQTAMVLGITAMTLYGDKLVTAIGKLMNFSSATKDSEMRQRELNKAIIEEIKNRTDDLVKLDLLYKATQDITKGYEYRFDAAQKLIDQFPETFGNLTAEKILAGEAADAYRALRIDILALAEAEAKYNIIVKESTKLVEIKERIKVLEKENEYENKLIKAGKYGDEQLSAGYLIRASKINRLKNEYKSLSDYIEELSKNTDISDLFGGTDDGKGGGGKGGKLKEIEKFFDDYLKMYNSFIDDYNKSLMDAQNKEISEVNDKYKELGILLEKAFDNGEISEQEHLKEQLKINERYEKDVFAIREKYQKMEEEAKNKEREKDIDRQNKALEDLKKYLDKQADLKDKDQKKQYAERVKLDKEEGDNRIKLAENAMGIYSSLYQMLDQSEQAHLEQVTGNEIETERIQREYATKRQQIALSEAIINGALAVMKVYKEFAGTPYAYLAAAIQAGLTAAQVAAIASQKFAEGEIDIHRPGEIRHKDSIPALLMPGETVMTTDETKVYKPVLKAIRENRFEDFIQMNYVLPELTRRINDEIKVTTAGNMFDNIKLKAEVDDYEQRRKLERLIYITEKNNQKLVNVLQSNYRRR